MMYTSISQLCVQEHGNQYREKSRRNSVYVQESGGISICDICDVDRRCNTARVSCKTPGNQATWNSMCDRDDHYEARDSAHRESLNNDSWRFSWNRGLVQQK